MAHLVSGVNKVRSLSEEGVNTGGDHDGFDLSLLDRRAGVDAITGAFGGRQRFSGQGRL